MINFPWNLALILSGVGVIFTKIYSLHSGYKVRPSSQAVAVETKEIEREEFNE